MIATVWSNLGYAGVFVAGLVVGGVAVLRLTGLVMDYFRRDREK